MATCHVELKMIHQPVYPLWLSPNRWMHRIPHHPHHPHHQPISHVRTQVAFMPDFLPWANFILSLATGMLRGGSDSNLLESVVRIYVAITTQTWQIHICCCFFWEICCLLCLLACLPARSLACLLAHISTGIGRPEETGKEGEGARKKKYAGFKLKNLLIMMSK